MNLGPIIQAQIDRKLIGLGLLIYVASDPPLRIWTGVGPRTIGASAIDPTGGKYLGLGAIGSIPSLTQLVNGQAQRIELTLSGVDERIVSLADAESDMVRGRELVIGMIFLGADLQPVAPPLRIWDGYVDVLRTAMTTDADFKRNRSVTLSVGTETTNRRRARLSYFTRSQQRRRSSDDAFCDRTALYSNDTELGWPV